MKKKLFILFIINILVIKLYGQSSKRVSAKDFEPFFGNWSGKISFIDYFSKGENILLAGLKIYQGDNPEKQILFYYGFPNEPKANGNDTLRINRNGAYLDDSKIIDIIRNGKGEGSLKIVVQKMGMDGEMGKRAFIKHTYEFTEHSFTRRKEVKFAGTDEWIKRNEYSFTR